MKIKNQVQRFLFILGVAFTLFSCDEDKEVIKVLPTIVEIAKADANFSILADALKKTGLETTLNSPGSYTVFAPTNAAFNAAGITIAFVNNLSITNPADKPAIDNLRLVLQNHLLGVGTRADDLVAFGYSRTFVLPNNRTGNNLFVNKSGNDFLINGGTATTVGAKITKSDIDASNGVVHVIDRILGQPTLVDHIVANPDLSTLLTIVSSNSTTATYGDQTLIKNQLTNATAAAPLTVFAPNNAAFKTATDPGGYLTTVPVNEANIRKILQYHVSAGNLTSNSATAWRPVTEATDFNVTTQAPGASANQRFRIEKGTVKLYELPALPATVPASLLKTVNIQATNGVIHIIDRVLRPVL
ncbi:MAG TPA: fasciclin domain-containing protein [Flavobacterium sp.]